MAEISEDMQMAADSSPALQAVRLASTIHENDYVQFSAENNGIRVVAQLNSIDSRYELLLSVHEAGKIAAYLAGDQGVPIMLAGPPVKLRLSTYSSKGSPRLRINLVGVSETDYHPALAVDGTSCAPLLELLTQWLKPRDWSHDEPTFGL